MITSILDVAHWERDDLHGNLGPALEKAQPALVIAKATQGKDYVDPSYKSWQEVCAGKYPFGAYHFGSNTATGAQQAKWFLQNAGLQTVMALDWEDDTNDPGLTMSSEHARDFVQTFRNEAGFWPWLYSGLSFLAARITDPHDVLGNCPLWLAAYGPTAPKLPPAWEHVDIFQYTDGKFGPEDQTLYPRLTTGFGAIDRSLYRGTLEDFAQFIKSAGRH